jgi:galactonate dehydratase
LVDACDRSIPSVVFEDVGRHDSPIFINRPMLDGARYPVPTAPGLGIDIDEQALAQAVPPRLFEFPHFSRKDGSHTNW